MFLIAGLGNPGKKYKGTRHNAGFMVLEKFKKTNRFPEFNISKKFKGSISEKTMYRDKKIVLLKPQTLMNMSGESVKTLLSFYKIKDTNLILAHDDLDIDIGEIKISKNKNHGGHNGVKSVIDKIGSKNFLRIRIGIKSKEMKGKEIEDFVLERFTEEEKKKIEEGIKKASKAIRIAIREGEEKSMNKFN